MRSPASTTNVAVKLAAALVAVAIGVWVYASFDPLSSVWFPRCTIKALTGFDCPGCGSQRAIHALLTGHPLQAWSYNAALVVSVPLLILIGFTRISPARFPSLTRFVGSRGFILTVFVLFILWTVGRNLPL